MRRRVRRLMAVSLLSSAMSINRHPPSRFSVLPLTGLLEEWAGRISSRNVSSGYLKRLPAVPSTYAEFFPPIGVVTLDRDVLALQDRLPARSPGKPNQVKVGKLVSLLG